MRYKLRSTLARHEKRMCARRVDRCPQCLECARRLQALALCSELSSQERLEGPARKVVRRVREQRTVLDVPGALTKGGCSFAWCSFGSVVRVRPRVCTSNFSSKEAGGDQALLGRLEACVRLEMASIPFLSSCRVIGSLQCALASLAQPQRSIV